MKVTPYLGVAHKKVEKSASANSMENPRALSIAKFSSSCKILTPARRRIFTSLGRDVTATLVAADSLEYGWPYIRRLNDLHDIIARLEGAGCHAVGAGCWPATLLASGLAVTGAV